MATTPSSHFSNPALIYYTSFPSLEHPEYSCSFQHCFCTAVLTKAPSTSSLPHVFLLVSSPWPCPLSSTLRIAAEGKPFQVRAITTWEPLRPPILCKSEIQPRLPCLPCWGFAGGFLFPMFMGRLVCFSWFSTSPAATRSLHNTSALPYLLSCFPEQYLINAWFSKVVMLTTSINSNPGG